MTRSEQWFERGLQVMPGGVNSPVRAFGAVGGVPRVIQSAKGCRLTDVDGRNYIDYVGSWGPMILGHGDPRVLQAVHAAVETGTSFGASSTHEVELAEEIVRRVPGVDQVRMVNSGTEAVMSAIRLARAATGREKIVKSAGCYHGHSDAMLVRAGSGAATLGLPDSPGVTRGASQDTLIARYNDAQSVADLFAAHGGQIAAVIVEPVAGNMGVVPPADGFLSSLREMTRQHGALLIFDEVMTGFRIARGGAVERYDVHPDLITFGKIIGGGFPVGAYGGCAELMKLIAPAGPVYQAGTLSGNPVAMAAGLATVRQLDASAYERLERVSERLHVGLDSIIRQHKCGAVVQRVGSMLTIFFADCPVKDFEDASRSDRQKFAAFHREMLDQGHYLPPSALEAWFVGLAHDQTAIDATIQAANQAMTKLHAPVEP